MLEFSSIGSSKYSWKAVTLSVILEKSDSIIVKYIFITQKGFYVIVQPRHLMCSDEYEMRVMSKLVD